MVVKNVFDKGPESWCSYDYHGSVVTGRGRVFVLGNWEREGGLNDAPYISCEETYWTPDVVGLTAAVQGKLSMGSFEIS